MLHSCHSYQRIGSNISCTFSDTGFLHGEHEAANAAETTNETFDVETTPTNSIMALHVLPRDIYPVTDKKTPHAQKENCVEQLTLENVYTATTVD